MSELNQLFSAAFLKAVVPRSKSVIYNIPKYKIKDIGTLNKTKSEAVLFLRDRTQKLPILNTLKPVDIES